MKTRIETAKFTAKIAVEWLLIAMAIGSIFIGQGAIGVVFVVTSLVMMEQRNSLHVVR